MNLLRVSGASTHKHMPQSYQCKIHLGSPTRLHNKIMHITAVVPGYSIIMYKRNNLKIVTTIKSLQHNILQLEKVQLKMLLLYRHGNLAANPTKGVCYSYSCFFSSLAVGRFRSPSTFPLAASFFLSSSSSYSRVSETFSPLIRILQSSRRMNLNQYT